MVWGIAFVRNDMTTLITLENDTFSFFQIVCQGDRKQHWKVKKWIGYIETILCFSGHEQHLEGQVLNMTTIILNQLLSHQITSNLPRWEQAWRYKCNIFIFCSLNPCTYQTVKEENNWGLTSNSYACFYRLWNKRRRLTFLFQFIDWFPPFLIFSISDQASLWLKCLNFFFCSYVCAINTKYDSMV